MFNTAAKLYFGLTALALVLAIGYWIGTGDRSGGLLLFALATSTLLAGPSDPTRVTLCLLSLGRGTRSHPSSP